MNYCWKAAIIMELVLFTESIYLYWFGNDIKKFGPGIFVRQI